MNPLFLFCSAVFVICATAIGCAFFLYPLLLVCARLLKGRRPVERAAFPWSVSLITIVRGSAESARRKAENSLSLEFPSESFECIMFWDGAPDIGKIRDCMPVHPSLKIMVSPAHEGKNAALNRAIENSSGQVLVFSDADALLDRDALTRLLSPFADPDVGGVCGQLVVVKDAGALSRPQHTYWQFDRLLKTLESETGSITSNTGVLYAIRRELSRPIPLAVTDDLYSCMNIVRQHKRFVFEPAALASIAASSKSPDHELRRRRRIVCRSLRGIWLSREVLNPFRFGMYSAGLFLNKVLRRFLPVLFLLVLFSSSVMAVSSSPMRVVLLIQLIVYASAVPLRNLAEYLPQRGLFRRLVLLEFYFFVGMVGTWLGLMDFLKGKQIVKWETLESAVSGKAGNGPESLPKGRRFLFNQIFRGVRKLAKRLLRPVFWRERFVVLKKTLPRPATSMPDREGVMVRAITAADQSLVAAIPHASAAVGFAERLATGGGVLVSDEDGPAGYAWYTSAARPREGSRLFHFPVTPPSGAVYIFDVLVAPAKRGRGYGSLLLAHLLAQAERGGRRSAFLFTGDSNHSLRHLCQALGFVELGELKYCRILGRAWSDTDALRTVGDEGIKSPVAQRNIRTVDRRGTGDEYLRRLIYEQLGFDMNEGSVAEICGGTNKCYSIEKAKERYFIRLPRENSFKLGIRRDVERAVLKAVSSLGVGAEIVFFSEDDGAMITAHVDGRQFSQKEFSSFDTIRKVVQTLKRIHNLTSVQYSFSPYDQIRDRIQFAKQRNIRLPEYFDDLVVKLEEIEKKDAINSRKVQGLCHNDLIVENFVFSESVRILDWEFSGMGDVVYDLATMSMNFSKRKQQYMLKCYFGNTSRHYYEHLLDMIFVARFWNAMWAVTLIEEKDGDCVLYLADKFFNSLKEKSVWESCFQKSQIPRVFRKLRRIKGQHFR